MKELKEVTIVCIDCKNYGAAISAIKKTLQQVKPEKTIFFTDVEIEVPDVETIVIKKIKSKLDYSYFVMKKLAQYLDECPFILIIQHDGYVLNGNLWEDDFYKYDYIGARWNYPDTERCVGNGGFSLRSTVLMKILANDDFIVPTDLEDDCICRLYGQYLENIGLKFAPIEVADKFSFELREPCNLTFGFHSYFHLPFKNHVVVKRTGANGDVIMAEPVLQYYHDKGYQVVLDTLPEIMHIFFNHPFRIKHISEMNPNIVPIKTINLDGSYESKPKALVLKTYYEFSSIKDGILRNSRLYVNQDRSQRLFNKFIVFHIDRIGIPHREVNGVSWGWVAWHYTRLGYTCIQVGKGDHEQVGTYFRTDTKEMLMFLLKGAEAVCAVDSGVAQLSVALGVPTAIFFGSVNAKLRYVDFENIEVIKKPCPTPELDFCYHNSESSVTGTKCAINELRPPCCHAFTEWDVIGALNKLLKLN